MVCHAWLCVAFRCLACYECASQHIHLHVFMLHYVASPCTQPRAEVLLFRWGSRAPLGPNWLTNAALGHTGATRQDAKQDPFAFPRTTGHGIAPKVLCSALLNAANSGQVFTGEDRHLEKNSSISKSLHGMILFGLFFASVGRKSRVVLGQKQR